MKYLLPLSVSSIMSSSVSVFNSASTLFASSKRFRGVEGDGGDDMGLLMKTIFYSKVKSRCCFRN